MLKKAALLLAVLLFVLSPRVMCAEPGIKISPAGWALLSVDIALSALSAWSLADRNTQAAVYNKLLPEIDNTTDANYWRLKYEKGKVDARNTDTVLAFSAAGAALLYTALDLFWFHGAFPFEPVVDPNNPGIIIREVF